MSVIHCIITRFSFRFKPDDPIDKLLSEERMDRRLYLFQKYCYSSIINQTYPKFYWIIIIDPLLPKKYVTQLEQLIEDHRNSEQYPTRGPREIWLKTWSWDISTGDQLGRTEWILEFFAELNQTQEQKPSLNQTENDESTTTQYKPPKYLITTRLDDDDCLVDNFTHRVRKNFDRKPRVKGFRYFTFGLGYQHYVEKTMLKYHSLPMIALGLTLVAELNSYPMCVYMGSHTRIASYLRDPKKHPRLLELYKRNNDLPSNPIMVRKQLQDRLWVIRTKDPVWVRNVHDFNLQKNIGRSFQQKQDPKKNLKLLKEKFNVKIDM